MTFLAPWALWVAAGVSAAVIALHILASKNPRVVVLPTTRFIPDVPLRATARALKLSDVLLMLLRVAAVMLVGVAFARPELTGAKRSVGRVVVVDWSAYVKPAEAHDSAARYFRDGDLFITFDSAAHQLGANPLVTLTAASSSTAHAGGSLSAALVSAMRAASALRGEADSVEIVLVSGFAASEFDATTPAIRATWPGRLRTVSLARSASSGAVHTTSRDVRGVTADDPVRAAASFALRLSPASPATPVGTGAAAVDSVRVERGSAAGADTTVAQRGLTLVRWPSSFDSSGFPARTHTDTAGAVIAGRDDDRVVVVSPFARAVDPPQGRVVARWADGAAAATERTVGSGCVRDVAIPIPSRGDLALRESTRRLVAVLTAPCAGRGDGAQASDSTLSALRGTGPLVATRALAFRTASRGHLTTWLLATALALILLEPLLRRQRASA